MIIGYARVSPKDQNLAGQVNELEAFGCNKIFTENQSGQNFDERAIYDDIRKKLRIGDVLVVHDLSDLGRSKADIKNEWESLMKNDIDIVVLNIPILDTRKYKEQVDAGKLITDMVPSLLSWMVEEERVQIKSAQRKGIEMAKLQGKYKGRKRRYHAKATGQNKVIYDEIMDALGAGTSVMDIHRQTGVARSTIYNIKNEL